MTGARIKFEQILKYPLLKFVGRSKTGSIIQAGSWEEAARLCRSFKWEMCQLMARNRLQRLTEENAWDRSEQWNAIVEDLRPAVSSFVSTVVTQLPLSESARTRVRDSVSWDILFICLEQEYVDVVVPAFYVPLLDPIYADGHFPCGWDGDEFSEHWNGAIQGGRLIVF